MAGEDVRPYPEAAYQNPDSPPGVGINWNLMEANNEGDFALSADERAVAFIAGTILERFDLPHSDDEFEERSDAENSESENEPEVVDVQEPGLPDSSEARAHKHSHTQDETATNRFWFPWPDCIACPMVVHCRLALTKQLDLFLWLLKVNNVDDVPSIKQMQKINLALQKVCGIETISCNGALGNKYFVNNLAQIIAQEMANPRVRPHLSFYPEDSGPKLSEACQGQRWLKELPDEQTTPMLRISGHNYYIYEPAMLDSDAGEFCIPIRWFARGEQFLAKCWRMVPVSTDKGSGWRVVKSDNYEVPACRFLKNFLQFQSDAAIYNVPHPSSAYMLQTFSILTRAKAQGSRVVVFPMWVYCDDTSGNVSKKWNEHNSFLMMPAGLPREEAQKEYNIHFLCTSNLARPLEMLDGIVDQLEKAQGEGIWVWDVEFNEPVLVIPEVLALLGDNPMQSKFACHIGLRGKLFCRACWVKGHDAMDGDDGDEPTRATTAAHSDGGSVRSEGGEGVLSDQESVAGSDGSAASVDGQPKKKKLAKRFRETMTDMVHRVSNFMKIQKLSNKDESTKLLRSFFTDTSTKLDTKTSVKKMRTENGLKDKFQMVFIDRLFESYKKKRGAETKRAALEAAVASLPANTMSPFLQALILTKTLQWKSCTLCSWGKDDKNELLTTQLSSFDVSGLGISPLAGKTLVQYSGSLTGRDFRAIAQVAPFVLYDLVSKDCFETWQALSKIIPLIWQPEINDVELHLACLIPVSLLALLTKEIDHFLLCAAKWTSRWFNKPKFHIFLHLPTHIRRFGPAILFATEAFESFNAIIRAKSVHSNRHAPSRDIAHAFAQGNRIRHLLSGGLFVPSAAGGDVSVDTSQGQQPRPQPAESAFIHDKSAWRTIGDGPKNLVSGCSTVTHYLGLDKRREPAAGISLADKTAPRPINQTLTGQRILSWSTKPGLFKTSKQVFLLNGDPCVPHSFVIVKHPHRPGETFVARVEELIQQVGSIADFASKPDGVLLQKAIVDHARERYGMPSVQLAGEWSLHSTKDLLCTVNVQHNCMDNHCAATDSIPVYQERTKTAHTMARIAHTQNLHDLVLNTAQMRDAVLVQPYCLNSMPMDFQRIVHQSVANEIGLRKKHTVATAKAPPLRPLPHAPAQPVASSSSSHLPSRVSELQFIHYPGHIP
ncbi:hypothetical protein MVEN_00905200 [Mycena venus]|uniref:Uncharacterized protein n=1 Tax=Mycena venus TaxID=2733690 RepID=A0A8H7D4K2_9AGAR|nr:hypothetical protein MVEN_00905200 [Mycena venus]